MSEHNRKSEIEILRDSLRAGTPIPEVAILLKRDIDWVNAVIAELAKEHEEGKR
jgi:hypothetical protein